MPYERLKQRFKQIAYAGCLPTDSEQERLRKAILLIVAVLFIFFGSVWALAYTFVGRPMSGAIPGGYALFSLLSVFIFLTTRHYAFFRFSQLFLILCLPFFLQWSLGGFRAGSAVMIWAVMAPIGALMFHGTRQAVFWFLAFLVLVAVSGLLDPWLAQIVAPLPDPTITAFFVMNFMFAMLIVYIVVNYYIAENRRIMSLIDEQSGKLKILNEQLEDQVKEQLGIILKGNRLTRFISNKLIDQIISTDEDPVITSERRKITVMFSDLSNFTDLVDSVQPEEVARLLNEYLTEMSVLINDADATLVQVIGDGLMIFFGAPDDMDSENQANKAMEMALTMQASMRQLGRKWFNNGVEHNIMMRIGIHQDYLTVGNFGSDEFMEYTAVGKGINLASRLESTCTPGKIKVSHPIYVLTRERFPYDDLIEENYKGIVRALQVCELDPDRFVD